MKEGEYDSSEIGPAQASAFRTSDEIEDDVRELISLNDAIHSKHIEVTVENGTVFLAGHVENEIAAEEAEKAARVVIGVTHVRNNLEVDG
jgi:osmotically-inducible protein OsmY